MLYCGNCARLNPNLNAQSYDCAYIHDVLKQYTYNLQVVVLLPSPNRLKTYSKYDVHSSQ